jgi:hypothetical protein
MTPRPADQTIPFDDALLERFRTCLKCSRVAQWMDVREVEGRAYFACLCWDCWARDKGWQRIDALLRARHGADGACSDRPGGVS